MGSTRLIAFLGTGNYMACRYRLDGQVSEATPLCHLVSARQYAAEGAISIVVLGSQEVEDRWFAPDPVAGGPGRYPQLLREAGIECPLGFRRLPPGRDERERWEAFQVMLETLSDEALELKLPGSAESRIETGPPDRIVVDITHGFRSQPFFAASAVAFARAQHRRGNARDSREIRLLYGAFEPEEHKKAPETYVADIWDLTQFLEILDWDAAIDGLVRHGKGDDLARLIRLHKRKALARLSPPERSRFDRFARRTEDYASALATVRIGDLLTTRSRDLVSAIAECRADLLAHIPLLEALLGDLETQARDLQAERPISPNGLGAARSLMRLYKSLQRYPELAIVCRESLLSAWMVLRHPGSEILQPGQGKDFRQQREEAEKELGRLAQSVRGEATEADKEVFRQLPGREKEIIRAFANMVGLRNDVEHGGYKPDPLSAESLRKNLDECAEKLDRIFREIEGLDGANPDRPDPRAGTEPDHRDEREPGRRDRGDRQPEFLERAGEGPGMAPVGIPAHEMEVQASGVFLNCSNHPIATWSPEQIEAARELGHGEPADYPGEFPTVLPSAPTGDVLALAEAIADRVVAAGALGAHVSGEYTLTFALVHLLEARGVPCYVATTERVSADRSQPDGSVERRATFRFVAWRRFPRLARGTPDPGSKVEPSVGNQGAAFAASL